MPPSGRATGATAATARTIPGEKATAQDSTQAHAATTANNASPPAAPATSTAPSSAWEKYEITKSALNEARAAVDQAAANASKAVASRDTVDAQLAAAGASAMDAASKRRLEASWESRNHRVKVAEKILDETLATLTVSTRVHAAAAQNLYPPTAEGNNTGAPVGTQGLGRQKQVENASGQPPSPPQRAHAQQRHQLRPLRHSQYYARRKRKADDVGIKLKTTQLRCRICGRRTCFFCASCSNEVSSHKTKDVYALCGPSARHRRQCFEEHMLTRGGNVVSNFSSERGSAAPLSSDEPALSSRGTAPLEGAADSTTTATPTDFVVARDAVGRQSES